MNQGTTNTNVHTGYRHIVDNFPLFGFGNPALACIQTAKELIENSIDACRNLGECSITVTLHLDHEARMLMLEVSDSGCGMADTMQGLALFCTSKSPESSDTAPTAGSTNDEGTDLAQHTGKFGLGLSACLLNSLMKTQRAMRITTKTKIMPVATITDFSFNCLTGKPAIERTSALPQSNTDTNASSLTEVTLCLEWIEDIHDLQQGKHTIPRGHSP